MTNPLLQALVLLVAVALAIRIAWELLAPALVPLGIVLASGGLLLAIARGSKK